jgi:hypothetical protein
MSTGSTRRFSRDLIEITEEVRGAEAQIQAGLARLDRAAGIAYELAIDPLYASTGMSLLAMGLKSAGDILKGIMDQGPSAWKLEEMTAKRIAAEPIGKGDGIREEGEMFLHDGAGAFRVFRSPLPTATGTAMADYSEGDEVAFISRSNFTVQSPPWQASPSHPCP